MIDSIVVGAGPNGLAAAIRLARGGRAVRVLEAQSTPGGGSRTLELTLPGYRHDVCSAIHPLVPASPFLRALPLAQHGLDLIHSPAVLAHPLDDGSASLIYRSVDETAAGLGTDAGAWRGLFAPLMRDVETLLGALLGPLLPPRHVGRMLPFGLLAARSAAGLARSCFRGEHARALFTGLCAHAGSPMTQLGTAGFGLTLAIAGHACGWPFPRGGSQRIADALVQHLESLGGTIECGVEVERLADLPEARTIVMDVMPLHAAAIAGDRLPPAYRRRLEGYRHGPGSFKVDWALDAPIPWRACECALAATVHMCGTMEEIVASEAAPTAGRIAERPYVILAQHTLFDASRAPEGKHTAWGYCHVPNGSTEDMTARIEAQIERFAPGFQARVLARSVRPPAALEAYDANLVGGDVAGGAIDLRQLLFRPMPTLDPYRTPTRGLYLCSAATPPGAGVHGMCGYHAAQSVLRRKA